MTVGTNSAAKNVTLTNNLATTLAISIMFTGAYPGDFSESDTCSGSVVAGSACTITVTFSPTAKGARTASLNVVDSANNSPQTVALTGTGNSWEHKGAVHNRPYETQNPGQFGGRVQNCVHRTIQRNARSRQPRTVHSCPRAFLTPSMLHQFPNTI